MNIDDFLDNVSGEAYSQPETAKQASSSSQKSSRSQVSAEVVSDETFSTVVSFSQYGWDGAVTDVVNRISQSIANDDYSAALDLYMQLKELPSIIVESDMRTQEKLKEEILKAHERILSHMKEQEKKHSSSSEKIKQLILLAFEELSEGREEVASGLYVKACQLYGQLPTEFKERNVKLHYDLLKVYFKIKEHHDYKEHEMHQNFLKTFNEEYQHAIDILQSDVLGSKQIHDILHDKVAILPNEEVQLKSKLLERLVRLRTQISYQEHKLALVHNTDAVSDKVAKAQSQVASSQSASSPSVKQNSNVNSASGATQSQAIPSFRDIAKGTGSSASSAFAQPVTATQTSQATAAAIKSHTAHESRSVTSSSQPLSATQSQIMRQSKGVSSESSDNSLQKVPLQFAGTQSEYAYDGIADSELEAEMQSKKYRGVAFSPQVSQSQYASQSQDGDYSDEDIDASDIQRKIRDVFKGGTFSKSITPLPPSKIIAQTQAAQSAGMVVSSPIADSDIDTIMSRESSEIIQKLRSLNKKDVKPQSSERLDDLQVRAEKIKQKLRDLHGDM
jgi:hypothetical protein